MTILTPDLPELAEPCEDILLEHDFEFFKAVKARRLMQLSWAAQEIATRFSILPFFEYFTGFNPSADAPYHNTYHSLCMLCNVYEGAWYEDFRSVSLKQGSVIRGLLVGALFHDFDHTAGKEADEINIEHAIAGLHVAQRYADAKLLALTKEELEVAISVIKVTKYPYDREPVTIQEMIIRDADLMQPYEADDAQLHKQFRGLQAEVSLQKKIVFTNQEFAVGVKDWYDKEVTWHTKWAKDKAALLDWSSVKERLKDVLMRD